MGLAFGSLWAGAESPMSATFLCLAGLEGRTATLLTGALAAGRAAQALDFLPSRERMWAYFTCHSAIRKQMSDKTFVRTGGAKIY